MIVGTLAAIPAAIAVLVFVQLTNRKVIALPGGVDLAWPPSVWIIAGAICGLLVGLAAWFVRPGSLVAPLLTAALAAAAALAGCFGVMAVGQDPSFTVAALVEGLSFARHQFLEWLMLSGLFHYTAETATVVAFLLVSVRVLLVRAAQRREVPPPAAEEPAEQESGLEYRGAFEPAQPVSQEG
ncbi:hypothetical protein ACIBG7_37535 [Nonomuraea sp. NPDC050328]|uniref:hypothetical protein n=1 Tax=Nonomuraea sp. NPDC050328 TaxID=3364361 RepID=UPI003793EFFD